jgi:FAD/FMN-containing dehydrogenase
MGNAFSVTALLADNVCRMSIDRDLNHCSLPYNLGNFQGYHQCNESVLIGRPATVTDLRTMVLRYDRVKASGVGHSWWQEQFCAGDGDIESINVVMTELEGTLSQIQAPVSPEAFAGGAVPPTEFPILVDEESRSVTVAAGISQRALLDYLSEYKFGTEPRGWTLPTISYFIDQTVGGAVATGTHGSSFEHGSLSSQITSLRLMVANGTIIDISPKSHPHLFNAAGVSVGRLGVVLDVTFNIVPDRLIAREVEDITLLEFSNTIKNVQDAYNAAISAGNDTGAGMALASLESTQAFWHPISNALWMVEHPQYLVSDRNATSGELSMKFVYPLSNVSGTTNTSGVDGEHPEGVFESAENPNKVEPAPAITANSDRWGRIFPNLMRGMVAPVVASASKSYVTMSEAFNEAQANNDPYDQFEVAVPFEQAGDCLLGLNDIVYGDNNGGRNISEGFRTPALIRFVGKEPFYLSPSNGYPVMYVNIEDHLSISSGRQNSEFDEVLNYFLDECDARLHWGKAGWPTHTPCFDGAEDYPETWCDFGCAVAELDPDGKFRSASDVWRWSASRAGTPVSDFSSCCSPDGFKKSECVCEKTPIC